MKTLRQLVQTCPRVQFDKAKNTNILKAAVKRDKFHRIALLAMVQRVDEKGAHDKHRVQVIGIEPDTKLGKGHVKVSCSCGFHCYWGQEYLLTKQDASWIQYSDGSRPDIRNPQGRIMLCHHVLRVCMFILKREL